MGRKIPGRKHRGIKDPLEQKKKRFERIANKINAPPLSEEDQAVPKSLLRIISLKQEAKEKHNRKKVGKKRIFDSQKLTDNTKLAEQQTKFSGRRKHVQFDYNLKQHCTESSTQFNESAPFMRQQMFGEADLQTFHVKSKRGREVKATAHEDLKNTYFSDNSTNEGTDTLLGSKGKDKKRGKVAALTKHEKLRAKKLAKKQEKEEREMGPDFDQFVDEVKFGEVVHQPPQLKALTSGKNKNSQRKPGCRDLLLMKFIASPPAASKGTGQCSRSQSAPNAARQRELEAKRLRAVEAYRLLKSQRRHNTQ